MTAFEPTKVSVAYVHQAEVAASFTVSMLGMFEHDNTAEGFLAHPAARLTTRCRTSDELPAARNQLVRRFLATGSDWLLWVDTDMGLARDTLDRLLAVADPTDRPVVGALCFASTERPDDLNGSLTTPQPTIYDRLDLGDGHLRFVSRPVYRPAALERCAGTGSACILIHRSVFEAIGGGWYDRITASDGSAIGEDLSFCLRAGGAGIPIHVDTRVRTSHLKPRWVAEADFWQQYLTPPAIDRVAVIVPVLRRPEHAQRFMTSLRASTGLATAYAVCDPDDRVARRAWELAGADQVLLLDGEPPGSFAHKANLGYRCSDEPWLFLAGSDVQFWPGWLDHAEFMGDTFLADVVGTNDLGNPRVLRGEHGTHLLVRRTYVDEVGASWDGPKVLCHEGYRHWYVDNEIVTAAKQRNTWVAAPGAVVEHLHPLFGKGVDDDVYQLGQRWAYTDRKLFERRRAMRSPAP